MQSTRLTLWIADLIAAGADGRVALIWAAAALDQEVTLIVKGSEAAVRPDSVVVEFDDERLVANTGLVSIATLSRRLGLAIRG